MNTRLSRRRHSAQIPVVICGLVLHWVPARNRKTPPKTGLKGPEALWFTPSETTNAVIKKLEELQPIYELSGISKPFKWAVSRQQALLVLENFISTRLADFGPYQDAMVQGESTLWHALLSPYLNLGLLHPLEVVNRLEQKIGCFA